MLFGSSQGVAQTVCDALAYRYYDVVCRVRRQAGVLVVRVARDSKLNIALYDSRVVLNLRLQQQGYLGLTVPVLVDLEPAYRYRYYNQTTIYQRRYRHNIAVGVHYRSGIAPTHKRRRSRFCSDPKNYRYNPQCQKYHNRY